MTEFKQIIGRGTRVRDDYGKYFFNILDYTGSATRHFADPDFDGEPTLIDEQAIDDAGNVTQEQVVEPEPTEIPDDGEVVIDTGPVIDEPPTNEPRKYYVDGGSVEVLADIVHELDADGKKLRVVKYTDYTAQTVRTLFPTAAILRTHWCDPDKRHEIIQMLEQRGVDFDQLAEQTRQPEADPFDLLCHVAYNAPLRTRRERADRLRKDKKDFFDQFGPQAQAILNELVEKYAQHGLTQFVIPDVLKVPPIPSHGNVSEIAGLFGGPEKLRQALAELQVALYAA
jgi:type I restriction enzyme R subunit